MSQVCMILRLLLRFVGVFQSWCIPELVYSRIGAFQNWCIPELVYSRIGVFQYWCIPDFVYSKDELVIQKNLQLSQTCLECLL